MIKCSLNRDKQAAISLYFWKVVAKRKNRDLTTKCNNLPQVSILRNH